MKREMADVLNFIRFAEGLKTELRHSYLSNERVESVAEHCWRLSLMVMVLAEKVSPELDLLKAMKLAVIHDLGEIIATDIPLFLTEDNEELKREKYENELRAMKQIKEMLGGKIGEEILNLWHEMEERQTLESKVVHALDKIEAQIQHNQADISLWTDWEKERLYSKKLEQVSAFNEAIAELCELVVLEGKEKIQN